MKKRSLFICNTIYQILVAHWIQYHHIKDVPADIWITDHIPDGKGIAERVEKCDVFESSSFIESKEFLYEYWHCDSKIRRKIWYNSKSEMKKFTTINDTYSELYIANFDAFTQLAYNSLAHSQKKLPKLILFEDGIGTYTGGIKEHYEAFQLPFRKIENIICNKIFGCVPFYGNLDGAILFTPQDMQWDPGEIIELDPLDDRDREFITVINYIFCYQKDDEEYKRKYIFFEQCFDFEGMDCAKDLELLEQIALKVGKNNIVVKMHPRSQRKCFKEHGFLTNQNTSIPWEVIALNMEDFSEKVFITINSGSVFNVIRILHKDVKMYSLQKLIEEDDVPLELKKDVSECVQNIFSRYSGNIILCDTIDQIQ